MLPCQFSLVNVAVVCWWLWKLQPFIFLSWKTPYHHLWKAQSKWLCYHHWWQEANLCGDSFIPPGVVIRSPRCYIHATHYSSPVWRCRCIWPWEGSKKPVSRLASFSSQERVKKLLRVRQTVSEAGLKRNTLVTRAAVLRGHDISQSHAVWQLNASPFYCLTSSFVRGNDLPHAEWHLPVQSRCCSRQKKQKTTTTKYCCWELISPVVSKG